ncbi:MAG: phosphopantetheine adenylyltransferase [Promethearchaeota archaeon]
MLKLVGLGGTFDHLHEGHKFLLRTAFALSSHICIGLTTEKMLSKKKYALRIEDYNTRKINLENFIKSFTSLNRVNIIKLDNPYGPLIDDPEYEGIIVSVETYKGALKINEIRINKGFQPLIIIVIPLLEGKNGERISSTIIREKLND